MTNPRRIRLFIVTLVIFVASFLLPFPESNAQISSWGCNDGCMVCRSNWFVGRYCGFANEEQGQCNCTDWWMGDRTGCFVSGEYCFGIIVNVP